MLALRDKMRNHVTCKVGNGKSVFFWHDKWWDEDIPSDIIPNEAILQVNMDGNEKVCDMIDNENWLWPAERKSSYPILQALSVLP